MARRRGRNGRNTRRGFIVLFIYAIVAAFIIISVDAAMYASSIPITYAPTAGSTGNVIIDQYSFIAHGVVFGNETGSLLDTTIGSIAMGVSVETNTYAGLYNIRAEIYNDGTLAHVATWNNTYVDTTLLVIDDYFTPGFQQGAEVRVRVATERS